MSKWWLWPEMHKPMYVGVTETSHPLRLNKHSLWSWICFLSIYTMRRSFDIPIRSQKTSLGMCSEVLPRPDPPPWVGLIIYTVGFYFERKCADLTETSLPYPSETKRECWMARCISYSWVSWKMPIPWLAFFFLHCMKNSHKKECVNWPVFGWGVLRGSPGPSMGWSARNIRAWSKVLTTKCSRSFSSDRSAWKP